MRKFFSTLIVITTVFTFTTFADDNTQPVIYCADGHMHLPGYSCTSPREGETGHGNRSESDDSTLTYIKSFIDGFNPFIYFLK